MRRTTTRWMLGLSLAAVLVAGGGWALLADDDHRGGHDGREAGERDGDRYASGAPSAFLDDPAYPAYRSECGACHLAYPPFLLPPESWRAVMGSLADHFGDNAEIGEGPGQDITAFLERHAAGRASGRHAERVRRATRGAETPLRVTGTDYFRGEHHEVPRKMVEANPEVGGFARCEACHQGAGRGSFREHDVRIPGHGRWDD